MFKNPFIKRKKKSSKHIFSIERFFPKKKKHFFALKKKDTRETSGEVFHHYLEDINKKAIFVLMALVFSQFLFMQYVADAGEMSINTLFDCTNEIRLRHTDKPVYMNDKLQKAAQNKLDNMREYDYWAHANPVTGEKPWDFVDAADYYYQTTGENLAIGFMDSEEVCEAWEKSETHLANIINDTYQEVGFAIDKVELETKGRGILVVQMFGSRDDFVEPIQAASFTDESGSGTATKESGQPSKEIPEVKGSADLRAGHAEKPTDWISKNIIILVIISSYFLMKFVLLFNRTKRIKARTAMLISAFLAIVSMSITFIYFYI